MARLWERALRRARLPVLYSQGFHAQPRIQFASALPTGFTGRAELLDVWLQPPVALEQFVRQLRPQLPQGVELVGVQEVDVRAPSLQSLLRSAEYRVAVEALEPMGKLATQVDALLRARELIWERTRKGERRRYDLRPLIEGLWLVGEEEQNGIRWHVLGIVLKAEPSATGRPDDLLAALGLTDRLHRIERVRLFFQQDFVSSSER